MNNDTELKTKWQQHINGLGHVSRMTVERFVTWQRPQYTLEEHREVVAELWDKYCDDRQARLYAADKAIQAFSEDI